jgi:hypothetical protein
MLLDAGFDLEEALDVAHASRTSLRRHAPLGKVVKARSRAALSLRSTINRWAATGAVGPGVGPFVRKLEERSGFNI